MYTIQYLRGIRESNSRERVIRRSFFFVAAGVGSWNLPGQYHTSNVRIHYAYVRSTVPLLVDVIWVFDPVYKLYVWQVAYVNEPQIPRR